MTSYGSRLTPLNDFPYLSELSAKHLVLVGLKQIKIQITSSLFADSFIPLPARVKTSNKHTHPFMQLDKKTARVSSDTLVNRKKKIDSVYSIMESNSPRLEEKSLEGMNARRAQVVYAK